MKENILEYHPNGYLKHIIIFHDNGCKHYEQYFCINGNPNRINAPAIQEWHDSGFKKYEAYHINGSWHNICNPSRIWYLYIGKIWEKHYHIYSNRYNKLTWMNLIKNI